MTGHEGLEGTKLLLKIGAGAAPALVEKLDSHDSTRRYWALGVLLDLYQQDAAGATPYVAVSGLVPLLIEARSKAGYADERDTAAEAVLAKIGEPAVTTLVAIMGQEDWSERVLSEIGVGAVPAVVAELGNEEPMVRYRAVGVLLRLYQQDKATVQSYLVVPEMVRADPSRPALKRTTATGVMSLRKPFLPLSESRQSNRWRTCWVRRTGPAASSPRSGSRPYRQSRRS